MNELTQIRIPYYITFSIALLALVLVLVLAWRNRQAKAARTFAVSVALELSWLIGYLLELSAEGLDAKLFWDKFQYIGAIFTPIAFLVFALQFTEKKVDLKRLIPILLAVGAIFQILIFADLWPTLTYVAPRIEEGLPWNALRYDFGLITNIVNYTIQGLALVYVGVLISGFFNRRVQARQLGIILVGSALPTVSVIIAFAFGLKFANQSDISPLMFAVSSVILAWGIFSQGLFNIVPIAREILFNSMSNILIILDQHDRVIDLNPAARKFLGDLEGDGFVGTHISLLQPELYQEFGKSIEIHTERTDENSNTYDFNITPLYNQRGTLMGRMVNANDITQQKKIEESLQQINFENSLRARRLNAITNVSQAISQIRDVQTLFPIITRQISEKFDFYHVGIFLFSKDKRFAELIAANSDGGKRMLERGHRLEIGQVGVVGKVAQDGTPRVALDVGLDAVYFDNPDLPETHSEMALPLKIGLEIIGVLDVQSKRKNVFSEEDTEVFSALANQVAIAIDNARQVEATQAALEEAHALTQEYVHDAWTKQAASKEGQLAYRFANDAVFSYQKSDTEEAEGEVIKYPVQIRGETIGTIKIRIPEGQHLEITENDKVLLEAIGERAGLALESARFLEETQRKAQRETLISDISSKIGASIRIDNIIQTTVRELGIALDASDVAFQLVETEKNGDE